MQSVQSSSQRIGGEIAVPAGLVAAPLHVLATTDATPAVTPHSAPHDPATRLPTRKTGMSTALHLLTHLVLSTISRLYTELFLLHFPVRYLSHVAALIFAHSIAAGQETPLRGSPRSQFSRARIIVYNVWADTLACLAEEYKMLLCVSIFTTFVPTFLLATSFDTDDEFLRSLVLVSLITSINSVILNAAFHTIMTGSLSLGRHDRLKTSWAFAEAAARCADCRFSELSIILSVPAASTAWSLTTSITLLLLATLPASSASGALFLLRGSVGAPDPQLLPTHGFITAYAALVFAHTVYVVYQLLAALRGDARVVEDRPQARSVAGYDA